VKLALRSQLEAKGTRITLKGLQPSPDPSMRFVLDLCAEGVPTVTPNSTTLPVILTAVESGVLAE